MQATGYIDGFIGPIDQIRVPVLDRGFLYGDSVYEVFRTYEGIPFLFDEHYQRLLHSAELSGMQISQGREELVDAIQRTIAASDNAGSEDVYVRYQITRGEGPVDLAPPAGLTSRLIIIVKPVPRWEPKFYEVGMTMSVPRQRRNAVNTLDPNIKGGNYLNNILALAESRAAGKDECLMLDGRGMVTECSNSNAWFVIDDTLVTPAAGNLVGLTRRSLVELLSEAGEPFAERELPADELPRATECFVTSATREVMPVRSLTLEDGTELSFPEGGGPMTRRARALYSDMIRRFIETHRDQAWF